MGASAQPTGAVIFNRAQAGLKAALHVAFLRACPSLDWAFCEAVLAGSHVGFLSSVPFWIWLSGRLCWRVFVRAFCKVVLAGAWKEQWAFCEAVLAGVMILIDIVLLQSRPKL